MSFAPDKRNEPEARPRKRSRRNRGIQLRFPLTDAGNAERLVAAHGQDLRYCDALGGWLIYQGGIWGTDVTRSVVLRAKETVRGMLQEASQDEDEDRRAALAKWAVKSESRSRIEAMIALARSEKTVAVEAHQFNRDPWLMAVRNGVVDLRTGKLLPHDPGLLITRMAGTNHDPEARCPLWLETLEQVFAGLDSQEVIDYLQRVAGYTLTGIVREEVFLLLWGTGRNGKGTIVETLTRMMGTYARAATMNLFLEQHNDSSKQFEIADLFGVRMTVASEAATGKPFDTATVKRWTGGDRRKGCHKHKDFFEYDPQDKLWLQANHKPPVRAWDTAFQERCHLLPFEHTFLDRGSGEDDDFQEGMHRADLSRKEALLGELPGILAWAVQGCLAWQEGGLRPPGRVRAAVDEYARESNRAGEFIETHLMKINGSNLLQSDIYAQYVRWSRDRGYDMVADSGFGPFLERAGFHRRKRNTGQTVLDCGWRTGDEGGDGDLVSGKLNKSFS